MKVSKKVSRKKADAKTLTAGKATPGWLVPSGQKRSKEEEAIIKKNTSIPDHLVLRPGDVCVHCNAPAQTIRGDYLYNRKPECYSCDEFYNDSVCRQGMRGY